jgi:hypothetical protein
MENNFPTTPVVKDGKATLEWHNEFGERIRVELDNAKYTSHPIRPKPRSQRDALSLLPLRIYHSDMDDIPLLPIITNTLGKQKLIRDEDRQEHILNANEADFIEHACKVLIEYSDKLQKQ